MLRAYKSYYVSKQQHLIPLYMCWGGDFPLTSNYPFSTTNFTTPYAFVFHNNSIFPKYCNIALFSENKPYTLLKKCTVSVLLNCSTNYLHFLSGAKLLTDYTCGSLAVVVLSTCHPQLLPNCRHPSVTQHQNQLINSSNLLTCSQFFIRDVVMWLLDYAL